MIAAALKQKKLDDAKFKAEAKVMHEEAAEEKVKEALDKELVDTQPKTEPKPEPKKEVKKPAVKKVVPEKKIVPKKKPAPKKAKKIVKKKAVKKVAKKVKKEETLDDEISKVYDEIHSDNSTEAASDDGGGFIGNHLKKIAEKKKAKEEAAKLAAERQYALDHPQEAGFIESSNIDKVIKHKNHKKGILERIEEKENSEAKEKAEDDSAQIMEQALNDPAYVEQVDLLKKMKKRGIISNGDKDMSNDELSADDKA